MSNYIEQLKGDPFVNRLKDNQENSYGIRVLGRGESLFFQENEKALICEIDAVNGVIYSKSIKNWEGEKKMGPEERNRIIALIDKYYKEIYNPNVVIL
jgi:hypothetical protein